MTPKGASARLDVLVALRRLIGDADVFFVRVTIVLIAAQVILVAAHFAVPWALHGYVLDARDGTIGGVDLDDEATLAVWLSSFQLLCVGVVCLLLSWQSRARAEHRSQQRLWQLAALLFAIMAVDETAGLHEAFGKGMTLLLPSIGLSRSVWFTLAYAMCLGPLVAMILWRMRTHRRAATLVVVAMTAWAGAMLAENLFEPLEAPGADLRRVTIAIEEGLEMLGAALLLLAFGLHLAPERRAGGELLRLALAWRGRSARPAPASAAAPPPAPPRG